MLILGTPPLEGIFITFERGRGLNFRAKFLGGVRVRVGFFKAGLGLA